MLDGVREQSVTQAVREGATHVTLPFFDAIFFPQWKVSFLPSATSLYLVLGGAGVGATVGKGNSGEGGTDTLAFESLRYSK